MIPLAQTLRPVSRARAALSRQLATAHRFAFMLDGQPGELRLQLAQEAKPDAQESGWRCHAGTLWLDNAAPLLSLFSACPALLPGPHDSEDAVHWYWTHYNHALSPALRDLFGELQPLFPAPTGHSAIPDKTQPPDDSDQPDNSASAASAASAASPHPAPSDAHAPAEVTLWLDASRGDFRVRSRLRTSHQTLQQWLSRPGWSAPRYPLPGHLAIRVPLILAEVTLSHKQLTHLEPGDLICPLKQYFSPQGDGSITLADRRLTGQLRMDVLAPYWFTVTELEECPVTTPFDDTAVFDNTAAFDADTASEASPYAEYGAPDGDNPAGALSGYALPPLTLALTVRCGYLTLTLQDLQQLAPGSVLTLQQATPGEATLYHGEQPLALGELVDVEGRLGLQITRRLGVDGEIESESSR
ncbi:type III secretion system cytoplasmic ring protein SctQ [Dickeya chrysanthemi]|uniref:type III secretion system cytoplasmic ring protein SctQ n=1 Tax=Dickeya chrysanthemi TaxID=556 RepID=UPI0003A7BBEA|nr:type III secretion system cytoplasmic ring protein SctQ [Dickeya chrysanthemi]MBX9447470.1 type III secretion system cytoplasmic ring protein SctQ [Dickeya chrysanthemi]